MNAVGIDISKGKSMIAAITTDKTVILPPGEFAHTEEGLNKMIEKIFSLSGEVRVVLEATGHYHEPVAAKLVNAGVFVSVVNPVLVHEFGNNTVRRVKTDKKDALKIARYCLENWDELREFLPQEMIRRQLKLFSRQYNLSIKTIRALENNLIALLDKTFPGLNKLFASRKRKDGRQKWIDFAEKFWHVELITNQSEKSFFDEYESWCMASGYQFKPSKARQIYTHCAKVLTTLPKNTNTGLLVTTSAKQVNGMGESLALIKSELTRLAALLPEHETVISLYGVGELTASQLIAEIGDVRRFTKRGCLTAFAGVDPMPKQSGKYDKKSNPTSKRGSPSLRKTLFQVVSTHLKHSPENEVIFQFIDRKRAEGKPYFVYMTAAANKFLRIYYAKVNGFLCNSA